MAPRWAGQCRLGVKGVLKDDIKMMKGGDDKSDDRVMRTGSEWKVMERDGKGTKGQDATGYNRHGFPFWSDTRILGDLNLHLWQFSTEGFRNKRLQLGAILTWQSLSWCRLKHALARKLPRNRLFHLWEARLAGRRQSNVDRDRGKQGKVPLEGVARFSTHNAFKTCISWSFLKCIFQEGVSEVTFFYLTEAIDDDDNDDDHVDDHVDNHVDDDDDVDNDDENVDHDDDNDDVDNDDGHVDHDDDNDDVDDDDHVDDDVNDDDSVDNDDDVGDDDDMNCK